MTIYTSSVATLSVRDRPSTYIAAEAGKLNPGEWSGDLLVHNINYEFPRTYTDPGDPNGIRSDWAKDYPTHANDAQAWNWISKACYDPITQRVMLVLCPAIETSHPWAQLLVLFDLSQESRLEINVYQDPLGGGTVGHGFDNNAICLPRRRLYKHAYWASGASAPYATGLIYGLDLDAITMARSSAEFGAARVETIQNPTGGQSTAGSLDFHPSLGAQGSLLFFWQSGLWRYDFATSVMSQLSSTLVPVLPSESTIHCVGHYNPYSDLFVFGGGSYVGAGKSSKDIWTIDGAGTIVKRDIAPFVLSVSQQEDGDGVSLAAHKVNFVAHPTKATDICIRCSNDIWEFDASKASGTQWTQIGTVPSDFSLVTVPSFSASIPDLNVIMVARYADVGQSKVRLYKPT